MSRYSGSHSRSDSRRPDHHESHEIRDVPLIEIIATVMLMVLGGVAMFGAVFQAGTSAQRSDPTGVASAELNLAAKQIQLQKFQACTPTNPEPYTLNSSALTPLASSTNLAIATNSLPLAQAPSGGISHPYLAKLSAINGVSGFAWSVSPSLPSGLTLSTDGTISGVPQAESSATYTFTVVSNGNSDSKKLSLTIVSVEVLVKNAKSIWTSCQNKSAEVLPATSNHSATAKSMAGSYRSGGSPSQAKSGNVQQIKVSTTVQGQELTRTITVSN